MRPFTVVVMAATAIGTGLSVAEANWGWAATSGMMFLLVGVEEALHVLRGRGQ